MTSVGVRFVILIGMLYGIVAANDLLTSQHTQSNSSALSFDFNKGD